jgi:aspartyl-tRNA(Asn)/glutamyl-tRNA(Gln) amidotransferase subunit A
MEVVPALTAVPTAVPTPANPAATATGLTRLGAGLLATLVRTGQVAAEEVVSAHLLRIADTDPQLHALVALDGDDALAAARALDARRLRGEVLGPLAGVPFVVKDNVDVRRRTTANGSRANANVLALRDAVVVERLRAAGALLVGRANMDELAMGASTQTSAYGATRNPWDLRRSPGGSSGGSAAAVAAGLVPVSIGTDTGGSIREPAAQCGVFGLAPSPGLVPMRGVVPFAPGLDRLGPLARTAADAAQLLAVLAGRPALASAALDLPDPRRLRIGLVHELCGHGNRPGVLARLAAVEQLLSGLGADVVVVTIPDAAQGLRAYMDITSAACVPLLEPYVRTGRVGGEVQRRWDLGRELRRNGARLADADAVRLLIARQAEDALRDCDVLLSPTMPTTAPLVTGWTADADAVTEAELADPMHAPYTDCWSVVANLARLAALSMPAGRSADDGMPVGVQLAGRRGSDALLLGLAAVLEDAGVDAS